MSIPAAHVRIWQQPDGLWRWCYLEPAPDGGEPVTLISHRAYENCDEAKGSALAAYRGVDVSLDTATGRGDERPQRWWTRLAVVSLVALALLHLLRRIVGEARK